MPRSYTRRAGMRSWTRRARRCVRDHRCPPRSEAGRAAGGADAAGRPRAGRGGPPRRRRAWRRGRQQHPRRRVHTRRRDTGHRRRGLGQGRPGPQGEGAAARGVRPPARRSGALHLPAPRAGAGSRPRLAGRGRHRRRLRDRPARRRQPAAAGADDQGGSVATIHPTTLLDPTYVVSGVVHYGVANMPALVPRTSTFALTNATLPYVLELAGRGVAAAARANAALGKGVNIWRGRVVHPAVAHALGEKTTPLDSVLG